MLLNLARRVLALSLAPVLAFVTLVAAPAPASALSIVPGSTADAAGVTPLGWSVVGLDSNRPADPTVGPDEFPVGARYCAASPVANLTASWSWLAIGSTQDDSLIKLVDASDITSFVPKTIGGKTCYDAYWNVKVTRSATSFDQDRGYQITFSGDVPPNSTTDGNRRIYVEKLVSQNRNTVGSVSLDGGGTTLTAGNTYNFTVTGSTSTSYDQLTFASIFPAPTFQLLDANFTYSTATGLAISGVSDQTYKDACSWRYMYDVKEEPGQCVGVGGAGGNIIAHYTVRVAPTASGSVNVNTLIYDFSGSSFHYNSDYGQGGASFAFTIVPKANYTVTYWPNAGTDTVTGTVPDSATVVQGGSHTVETATITRTDGTTTYVFVGWNTNQTGTGTAYKPGDVITPTGNVNLYAMWVPVKKWALAYNLQGGIEGGAPKTTDTTTIAIVFDETHTAGESITVSAATSETITKPGYTFTGWNTEADGTGTAYAPSSIVPNPGSEQLVVLYAQWAPQERSVMYDPNDPGCSGTLVGSQWTDTSTLVSAPYTIKQVTDENIAYTCSGATFTGWNTAQNGTGSSFPPGYVYTGTGPLTLYAQWANAPTPSYIVTYLGNGNTGGTQPIDLGAYPSGGTTTVLANSYTRTGYTFSGWNTNETGTGITYAVGSTLTFANSDIVLYAKWTAPKVVPFPLKVSVVGSGSTTPASGSYEPGSSVVVTATPAAGWKFVGWSGDCVGSANPLTVMMFSAKECVATFTPIMHTLTTSTTGSGSVTPGGTYKQGESTTLTATPAPGWRFTGWSGACVGTDNPLLVTLDASKDCVANFAQNPVLTAKVVGSGSVAGSLPLGTPQLPGTKVTLTATPADGWVFAGWSGACSGTDNPLTVTLDVSKECTATFTKKPILTTSVVGQGSIDRGVGQFPYLAGSKVTLLATPAAGWFFTGWKGACTGTAVSCDVVMDADKAVVANFVQGVSVTAKVVGSGSVVGSVPLGTPQLPGTKVTLTATPADGWVFAGWSGACSGTDNPLSVTLDVSKECTATFTKKPEELVARNDTYRTTPGTPLRLPAGASILGNDGGTVTRVKAVTKTKNGTISLAPNGKLVYTPKKGFVGVDSFRYRAFDSEGRSVIATVKIIVAPKTPTDIKTGD